MAGPGSTVPKGPRFIPMSELRRALSALAELVLHTRGDITLSVEDVDSRVRVVRSVLAGATREGSTHGEG